MFSRKKKTPTVATSQSTPAVTTNPTIEGPKPDLDQVESPKTETPILDQIEAVTQGPNFGETSAELLAKTDLEVSLTGSFRDAASIPGKVGSQLLAGIAAEGYCDAQTVQAALDEYVDEGHVEVYTIVVPETGQTFTWLRFTAGDTEVGYIFAAGSTELTALVSDGEILPG